MTVCRVGVGARVNRRTRRAVVLPSSAARNEDEDGSDHGNHEDEARDGDADGECAGGQTELVRILQFFAIRAHARYPH